MSISKKPRLLIAQGVDNAQNTRQKLGNAFSYLERKNYAHRIRMCNQMVMSEISRAHHLITYYIIGDELR